MNRWDCQERECRASAVGEGGAVGLRAIGWFFQAGPPFPNIDGPHVFCPAHHPQGQQAAEDSAKRIQAQWVASLPKPSEPVPADLACKPGCPTCGPVDSPDAAEWEVCSMAPARPAAPGWEPFSTTVALNGTVAVWWRRKKPKATFDPRRTRAARSDDNDESESNR